MIDDAGRMLIFEDGDDTYWAIIVKNPAHWVIQRNKVAGFYELEIKSGKVGSLSSLHQYEFQLELSRYLEKYRLALSKLKKFILLK